MGRFPPDEQDFDDDFDADDSPLKPPDEIKSQVVHIRVDPVMWRKVKAAALRADKKPCAWVRRLIQREIDSQARRKRK